MFGLVDMSSILKLRIQGIRAFDNYTYQEIEFLTPLTLISGPNGVGKTTIIECLRYITTGDLPPNSKGGAFVHDPRISGEAKVYAQVMLSYKNAQGRPMVVTRNMELTSGKNGRASRFKTLDSHLKVYHKNSAGKSEGISSRCADVNIQIPLSLGVPPPILNFVIFCHQEDSLWPLSEPTIVKKRFDEIFEATRYTKALEELKTLRKNYMQDINIEKVKVDQLESDAQRVKELKQELKTINVRLKKLEERDKELNATRIKKSDKLYDLTIYRDKVVQIQHAYDDAVRFANELTESVAIIEADIKELDTNSSESELQSLLEESDGKFSRTKAIIDEFNEQKTILQTSLNDLNDNLSELANQQGRIEQASKQREVSLKKLKDITGDYGYEQWLQLKNKESTALDDEIDALDVEHRAEEETLSSQVSVAEAKRLQLRRLIVDNRKLISETELQIVQANASVDEHEKGLADGVRLQKRFDEIEKELEVTNENLEKSDGNGIVDSLKADILAKEGEAAKVRKLLQETIEASGAQSRIIYLRDELNENENNCINVANKLIAGLHLNIDVGNDDFLNVSQQLLSKAHDKIESDIDIDNQAKQIASNIKSQMDGLKSRLKDVQRSVSELESHQASLSKKLPSNFEERLIDTENKVINLTEQSEQLQFAHSFFSKALEEAENESKCVLCDHVKDPAETEIFVTKIRKTLSNLSISPEQADKELDEAKDELTRLREMSPVNDDLKLITQKLVKEREVVESLEEEISEILKKSQDSETKVRESAKNVSENKVTIEPLSTQLTRLFEDHKELKRKIELEETLANGNISITPQQAQMRLDKVSVELSDSRQALETEQAQRDKLNAKIRSLEINRQRLQLKLSEVEVAKAHVAQAKENLATYQQSLQTARNDLENAETQLAPTDAEIKTASDNLKSKKFQFAKKERALAEKRRAVVAELNRVEEIKLEIAEFDKVYGNNPMQSIIDKRNQVLSKKSDTESRISELNVSMSENEKILLDIDSYKRNLMDNLKLRQRKHRLDQTLTEKERYHKELQRMKNETTDHEEHIQSLQNEISDILQETSNNKGESKILLDNTRKIQKDLGGHYKNTMELYAHAVANLSAFNGAVEDILKCVKALDAAIMEYHSIKMEEINSILDETWKSTYTGTDIDRILIKSESDVGSASTRAAYNYRVCMIKQDTELDMRGRCSAGQKVLACILIRMALAECFGNNCGLLVLDEPTTNLDHGNIDSLACSLSEVIASRKDQRNFQLIVITHDERFLTKMNPSAYCNFYYKLERDSRELSKVTRMPISSLNK